MGNSIGSYSNSNSSNSTDSIVPCLQTPEPASPNTLPPSSASSPSASCEKQGDTSTSSTNKYYYTLTSPKYHVRQDCTTSRHVLSVNEFADLPAQVHKPCTRCVRPDAEYAKFLTKRREYQQRYRQQRRTHATAPAHEKQQCPKETSQPLVGNEVDRDRCSYYYYTTTAPVYHRRHDCGRGRKIKVTSVEELPQSLQSSPCQICDVDDSEFEQRRSARHKNKVREYHRNIQESLRQYQRIVKHSRPRKDCNGVKKRTGTHPSIKFAMARRTMQQRKLAMQLTKQDYYTLLKLPCTYCGVQCLQSDDVVHMHGVDRIDNDEGYVPSNVVTACSHCNMSKNIENVRDFVRVACNVAMHQGTVPPDLVNVDYDTFSTRSDGKKRCASYSSYKNNAKNKNLEFSISRDLFKTLASSPCEYCGKPPSRKQPNGVDRVDNARGYADDNCVACCMRCNRCKYTLTRDEFVAQCTRIALQWHRLLTLPSHDERKQHLIYACARNIQDDVLVALESNDDEDDLEVECLLDKDDIMMADHVNDDDQDNIDEMLVVPAL